MILEFPEWLPDLPPINNPGMTVAKNIIPAGKTYKKVSGLNVYSTALDAYARGAYAARDTTSGDSLNFAGNETKLYLMDQGVWSDKSKLGGYALGGGENWEFTQFGDRVIAVNINEPMQSWQINVSTKFADLSADSTRPKARSVATIGNGDFVMVANTVDSSDGAVPYRVRWSKFRDATSWTVSATDQADYQDLNAEYGWCNRVIGGGHGTVFQDQAITRFDYVGSPLVFQVSTVETNRGSRVPKSIIPVGQNIFYLGMDGFYVFDGYKSESIGYDKIDRTILNELNFDFLDRVSAAVDYRNQIIAWAYPVTGANNDGTPTKILYFNYSSGATKRWTYAEITTELLANTISEGYTLDQLDQWETDHGYPVSIDELPYSLDSRIWSGGDNLFTAFNSDHKLCTFDGTPLTALLETAEVQLNDGQRTNLLAVRPVVDGIYGSITMQVGTRNLQNETVTYGSSVSPNSTGNCEVRSNARYHRLRLNIAPTLVSGSTTIYDNFDNAIGVEVVQQRKAGKR